MWRIFAKLLAFSISSTWIAVVNCQESNFDITSGSLVYYHEDTRPIPSQQFNDGSHSHNLQRNNANSGISFLAHSSQTHVRNYRKGRAMNRIFTKNGNGNTESTANRQGQRCRGICRYIPDRDFCPTTVAKEFEADDYYEDYSDESSELDDNNLKRTEPSSEELDKDDTDFTYPNGNSSFLLTTQGKNQGQDQTSNLHVVYPAVTRFATSWNPVGVQENKPVDTTKKLRRDRASARRARRFRRPQTRTIGLRPSGLEQEELLIRWDRVVERGPFIGGDILLPPIPPGVQLRQPRYRFQRSRWPKGVVPYVMDSTLNTCRQNAIFDAMDDIEDKTCIRFVERRKEKNYINIQRAYVGCSSYVGMIGGVQPLNLSTGCFSKFTITHELLHSLGFDHEQSRADRDNFIEVDFDNVLRAKESQFELSPVNTGSGFPYDLRSIMHYSAFLFAVNKCEPTIYPVNEKIDLCDLGIGNGRGGMTSCDTAKINRLYKCGKKYSKKCRI